MTRPSISCIVPVHNGAAWLAEALDSLLAQTVPPLEIVVVDDGSTDATATIAERYGDPIRLVRQERGGPAAARNRGVALARGALIAFQDADDRSHPQRLERQWERLRAVPGAVVCLTHVRNFWIEDLAEERERMGNHPRTRDVPGTVTQCGFLSRAVFETVGGFDVALATGEDQDWHLRARDAGMTIEILPDVLLERRIHHDNLTRREAGRIVDDLLDAVKRSIDRGRGRSPGP